MMMKQTIEHRIDIASGAPGAQVLIIAGVHGDEWEPMIAAVEIASQLPNVLAAGKVTIVPVANVDAYRLGTRCAPDGLDFARVCPGSANGTPTERAAFRVSALIRQADYLVDMHTGGRVHDIYPMAGYMMHPDQEVLKKQVRMAQMFNMPVIWGTDPLPEGRTLSVARDAKVPAIYLEYGGGDGFRKEVVKKYTVGILNLLKDLGMIEGTAVQQDAEQLCWVEDARSDSGSFQSKMPSPVKGIFMAAQGAGNRVRQGDDFGTVTDPETGRATGIKVPFDGMVLAVRMAVGVKPGDALGAILPISRPGKVTISKDGEAIIQQHNDGL